MSSSTFYNSQSLVGIGSVGIGTTSPLSALHVQGSQYYTGDAVRSAAHLVPNQTNSQAIQNWINFSTSVATGSWWMTPATAAVDLFNVGSLAGSGAVYSSHGMVIFPPGDGTGIISFYPETETYLVRITATIPSGATAGGFAVPGNLIVCNPTYGSVYTINSTILTSAFLGKIPGGQYSGCLTANNVIFAPQGTPSNVVNFNYATGAYSNVLALPSSGNFGKTWVSSTTPPVTNSDWSAVAWSPQLGLFAAVGSTGQNRGAYSTDGKNWVLSTTTPNNTLSWKGVAWSSQLGLFVAIANSGTNRGAYSTDGKIWVSPASGYLANQGDWVTVAWSPQLGLFVTLANGNGGTYSAAYSTDGVGWTAATTTPDINYRWSSVAWSPQLGLFAAVATGSTGAGFTNLGAYSTDGKIWVLSTTPPTNAVVWNSVAWSPQLGLFAAVGSSSGNLGVYSTDGKNWVGSTITPPSAVWNSVAWSPQWGLFVAVASSTFTRGAYSTDGKIWFPSTTPSATSDWYSVAWSSQLGLFATVASLGANRGAYSAGPAQQQGIQLLTNGNVIIPSPSTSNVIQFDPVSLTSSNIFVGTDGFNGLTLAPNGNVIGTPNKSNIIVISPSLGISSNVTIPSANTNVFTFSLGACLLPSGNIYFPSSYINAATNVGSSNAFTFDPVSLKYSNLSSTGATGTGFGSAILLPSGKVVLTPAYSNSYVGIYNSQTPVDQTFCASPYFNKS